MMKKDKRFVLLCGIAAVISCLAGGLNILDRSAAASAAVQDMRGSWDGFIAVMGNPPEPVRTEITSQTNRRFFGTLSPPEPVQPISIEGTVSASGKVNAQGQSSDGTHAAAKYDLTEYGGGAAILNGSLTRFSNDGTFIIPCVLVMRAFAGDPPDPVQPSGRYLGNMSADGVTGQIDMTLSNPPDPVRPTSFPGSIQIVLNGQTHSFDLQGTASSAGRVIAIAHGTSGHMVLDAVLAEPPDPVQPATINGSFTIEFGDGSVHEGTFQTQLFRSTTS